MLQEHHRIKTRGDLTNLSLYLEFVKGYNVEFLNKLIELDKVELDSLDNFVFQGNPAFLKEALMYNIYYNSLKLIKIQNQNNAYLTYHQNFDNNSYGTYHENYYLNVTEKDSDEIIYSFTCPENLKKEPLYMNLYGIQSNQAKKFYDNIIDFYNLSFEQLENENETQKILSRKYPLENPILVVKNRIEL